MAKSLVKLRAEIQRLQHSFDSVVATMKKEIAFHGLTVEDLFGSASAAATTGPLHAASGKSKSTTALQSAPARPPKYGDAAGNVWGGMGKRPAWLVAAIDAGKTKESFLLGSGQSPEASGAPSTPGAKNAPAKKALAKKAKPSKTAAPIAKVAAVETLPVKAAASARKTLVLKATPARRPGTGKAGKAEIPGKAATPSKKPSAKSAVAMKNPSAAIQKSAASAKAKTSKTVTSEVTAAA